jgi:hypothetical protein
MKTDLTQKKYYAKILPLTAIFVGLVIIIIFPKCKERDKESPLADIKNTRGKAVIHRKDLKLKAKQGEQLFLNDRIETGDQSAVIAHFKKDQSIVEIQENSSILINEYASKNKMLFLKKGKAWLKVKKLKKGDTFLLKTPTTVAAVRGTKFYTFILPDEGVTGTCVCEGNVEFLIKEAKYKQSHHKDYLILAKDDKAVILTAKELIALGKKMSHFHSKVNNSPLGPKEIEVDPKVAKKIRKYVEKKFKELN